MQTLGITEFEKGGPFYDLVDAFLIAVSAAPAIINNINPMRLYEVVGSYEYLYAYPKNVTICPLREKMLIEGKAVALAALRTSPCVEKRLGAEVKIVHGRAKSGHRMPQYASFFVYVDVTTSSPMIEYQ